MKKLLYLFLLLLLSKVVMGQDIQPPIDSIACYFNELKIATAKNKHLWNKDLYGPMMLINPETRRVFTNIPDAENELTFENGIYTGDRLNFLCYLCPSCIFIVCITKIQN